MDQIGLRRLQFPERRLGRNAGITSLGQQPSVLDRDDRLVGEGAHQFNLPFGKRLDPLTGKIKHAGRLTFAQQRHAERGSHVADGDHLRQSVIPVGGKILDLHHRQPLRCPSDNAAASGLEDKVLSDGSELRREGEGRDRPIHIAIAFGDHSHFSAAEPGSGFDHGIQNRLQIEGRAADDLEDITRRHLIFERLAQLLCRVAECGQRARHRAHLVRPGRRDVDGGVAGIEAVHRDDEPAQRPSDRAQHKKRQQRAGEHRRKRHNLRQPCRDAGFGHDAVAGGDRLLRQLGHDRTEQFIDCDAVLARLRQ